ncbi:MAG TPA: hypothetical protein VHR64_05410 [Thermomicrobiales bacterium]|jgi:hypothetical protein|nr:hypothetical protein [Thermomicrobiales bacterium]
MSNLNSESIGAVRDQAAQLLQSVIDQATARAMEQARATKKQSGRLSSRLPGSKSAPTVRDVALNAATAAIELWQSARDRAGDTVGSVQSTVTDSAADIKHSAQGVTSGAAQRVAGVKDSAQGVTSDAVHRVAGVKDDAVDRVKSVSHAVGDLPHKAADTSKAAATTTAKTGRNMFGLVVWTGAAGAIIYYAFLNEERREQVRQIAMQAISEARTLLQDLQGQDGEFAS